MLRQIMLMVFCLAAAGFIFSGCSVVTGTTTTTTSSTTTTTYAYATATLTHLGFDFAAGETTGEVGISDGEVINWAPDPSVASPAYAAYDMYVWWRSALNYMINDGNDYAQNLGTVELSSVTTPPSSWPSGEV